MAIELRSLYYDKSLFRSSILHTITAPATHCDTIGHNRHNRKRRGIQSFELSNNRVRYKCRPIYDLYINGSNQPDTCTIHMIKIQYKLWIKWNSTTLAVAQLHFCNRIVYWLCARRRRRRHNINRRPYAIAPPIAEPFIAEWIMPSHRLTFNHENGINRNSTETGEFLFGLFGLFLSPECCHKNHIDYALAADEPKTIKLHGIWIEWNNNNCGWVVGWYDFRKTIHILLNRQHGRTLSNTA